MVELPVVSEMILDDAADEPSGRTVEDPAGSAEPGTVEATEVSVSLVFRPHTQLFHSQVTVLDSVDSGGG
jgi:hypothetical protein